MLNPHYFKRIYLFIAFVVISLSNTKAQEEITEFDIKVYPFDKNSNNPSSIAYLDTIFSDYNHFFMDEYHGKSVGENLKKKFIHYLAVKKGLDKIVMEEPYAYGYWVNQYLPTGDTVLLKNFLTNYYLTDYGKSDASRVGEYYDFFEWVHDLNSKQEIKIRVEGIDMNIVNLKSDFWTLKQLFEDYNLTEEFPKDYRRVLQLEQKKKVSHWQAKRWIKNFNKNKVAKEDILIQKLKDNFIHFDKIISNLSDALKMHTIRSYFFHPTGYRDSLMHIQYIQQVKPDEVAFSQFGGWHMLLSMGEKVQQLPGHKPEFKSFTSILQKNSDYSGRCLSINLIYGEKDYTWGSYFFSNEEYNELRSITKYQEVLLDFRNAKGAYSNISEYYKIAIFLNGRVN